MTINLHPDRDTALTPGKLYHIPSSYLPYPYRDIKIGTHVVGMYLSYRLEHEGAYAIYQFLIGKKKINACVLTSQFEPGIMHHDHENQFLRSLIMVK